MRAIVALALIFVGGAALQAHEGDVHVGGLSAWDAAALGALLLAGTLYAVGSWRLAQRGAHVRRLEPMCFWSGWAVMFLALAPPMDTAAELTFSMHMVQHELLMLIGAPLMIVGRPIVPWLWALSGRARTFTGSGLQQPALNRLWRWATTPVIAWAVHGLVVWIWHAPLFYEAAVGSEAIHAFQHATFVGSAVLFWWGLVYGRYGRAAYGASVLYVFTTMVHTGVLGAAFALSTTPFYAIYQERAAAAGVDPVSDQQLAGLYMWIPAGAVLMISGLALLVAWLAEAERRVKQF
jgi:putative membrane protein